MSATSSSTPSSLVEESHRYPANCAPSSSCSTSAGSKTVSCTSAIGSRSEHSDARPHAHLESTPGPTSATDRRLGLRTTGVGCPRTRGHIGVGHDPEVPQGGHGRHGVGRCLLQVQTHDDGVPQLAVAAAVVAAEATLLLEAELAVEGDARLVVRPHLQADLVGSRITGPLD